MKYGYKLFNHGLVALGFNLTDFKGCRAYTSLQPGVEISGSLETDDIEDACLRIETLAKAIFASFPVQARMDGDTQFPALTGLNYGRRVHHPVLGTFDVVLVDPNPLMAMTDAEIGSVLDSDR